MGRKGKVYVRGKSYKVKDKKTGKVTTRYQKGKWVKKTSKKSSSKSRNYEVINGTKVFVGSNAAADQGKDFGGTKIHNSSKGSSSKGRGSSKSRLQEVQQQSRLKSTKITKNTPILAKNEPKLNNQTRTNLQNLTKLNLVNSKEKTLVDKALTGESMSPQELKQLNNLENKKLKELNQLHAKRLKNIPKDIAQGTYEVGKEIVGFVGGSVKGAFNYGKDLRKRFDKGENNPLFNDIHKLGVGSVDVAKFVKDKPNESAAIVGMAMSSMGGSVGKAFESNPTKALTKSVLYLFPGTVIKGAGQGVTKTVKGVETITQAKRLVEAEKVVAPVRKSLTNVQNIKLNKALKTISKDSSKTSRTQKINNFLNKAAKEQGVKLPKTSSVSKKISTLNKESKVLDVGKASKSTKVPRKSPKKPVKVVEVKGTDVKIKSYAKTENVPKPKPKRTRDKTKFVDVEKGSKIKKSDFKKIETQKIQEAQKQFVIIEGDKMKKVSKADFIKFQKSQAKSKKLSVEVKRKQMSPDEIDKMLANVKAREATQKGMFGGMGKKGQARLFRGNKEQVQQMVMKETKALRTKVKAAKSSKVKNSKANKELKERIARFKSLIESGKANKLISDTRTLTQFGLLIKESKEAFGNVPAVATGNKKAVAKPQDKKTGGKTGNDSKKGTKSGNKTGTGSKTGSKTGGKTGSSLKTVKKVPKKVAKKPVTKPKTTKPPKRILSFDTPLAKGERFKFDMRIKRKGKVQTVKLGLPLNKALKKLNKEVDNSLARSAELVIVGVTKAKDVIKPNMSKFRSSKTKTSLKLVEKTKHSLDTVGEKKGAAKARKSSKSKKRVVKKVAKKKVVKKSKKKK